jgi:hypothetical protein
MFPRTDEKGLRERERKRGRGRKRKREKRESPRRQYEHARTHYPTRALHKKEKERKKGPWGTFHLAQSIELNHVEAGNALVRWLCLCTAKTKIVSTPTDVTMGHTHAHVRTHTHKQTHTRIYSVLQIELCKNASLSDVTHRRIWQREERPYEYSQRMHLLRGNVLRCLIGPIHSDYDDV